MTDQSRMTIVTPSYPGDFERAQLLVDSLDRFPGDAPEHVLIVGNVHIDAFAGLRSDRTRVVAAEEFLPEWITSSRVDDQIWKNERTGALHGWAAQQLSKIAFARAASQRVVIFADSDMAFVKPFDTSRFLKNDRIRLLRVEGGAPEDFDPWYALSDRLLGIEPRGSAAAQPGFMRRLGGRLVGGDRPNNSREKPNFVGNLVAWSPPIVDAMCRRIEDVTGRHWADPLSEERLLSEYTLYGEFLERVACDASTHFPDDAPICAEYWGDEALDDAGLDALFASVAAPHLAVMVTSRAGIPASRYREKVLGAVS